MFRKAYLLKLSQSKRIVRPKAMLLQKKSASPNFCLGDLFTSEVRKYEFQMQEKTYPNLSAFEASS